MPATYPSTLPNPTVNGFGITVAAGVIRSEEPNQQAQRRVFANMPQVFSLQFVMTGRAWYDWRVWMEANGVGWFWMNLGGMYAGKVPANVTPTLIRITSEVQASIIGTDLVQINLTAEAAPSMAAQLI